MSVSAVSGPASDAMEATERSPPGPLDNQTRATPFEDLMGDVSKTAQGAGSVDQGLHALPQKIGQGIESSIAGEVGKIMQQMMLVEALKTSLGGSSGGGEGNSGTSGLDDGGANSSVSPGIDNGSPSAGPSNTTTEPSPDAGSANGPSGPTDTPGGAGELMQLLQQVADSGGSSAQVAQELMQILQTIEQSSGTGNESPADGNSSASPGIDNGGSSAGPINATTAPSQPPPGPSDLSGDQSADGPSSPTNTSGGVGELLQALEQLAGGGGKAGQMAQELMQMLTQLEQAVGQPSGSGGASPINA